MTGKKKTGFAARFSELRKDRGLMQKEIAEKLGVTSQAVSKWETGQGTQKFEHIPLLASLLVVSINFLFEDDKKRE